jgi:hypothetical protein
MHLSKAFSPRILILFATTTAASICFGQTATALAVPRDQKAIEVLTRSMSSLGGSPVTSASTGVVTGQVVDPDGSTVRTFKTQYLFSPASISFRKEVTSADGTSIFGSGGGSPGFQPQKGKAQPLRAHVTNQVIPLELPAMILSRALLNSKEKILLVDSGSTSSPIHVKIEDESTDVSQSLSTQDWYLDPTTFLPIRVVYKISDVANPFFSIPGTCDYMSFTEINGVLMPLKIWAYEEKVRVAEITFSSVQLNSALPTAFDVVPGVN